MGKLRRFQLTLVKMVWTLLLILLLYNFLDSRGIEHYFITATTFIMLIHIGWGVIFYIKHVGPSRNLIELPLDIAIIGLLLMAIFSMDEIVKWFIIFGTFFVIVIIKYTIDLSKTKKASIRKYIITKIKAESLAILLFYFGAVFGAVLDFWWIPRFLSVGAFLAQIPFIYWLVFKKRVYKVPSN